MQLPWFISILEVPRDDIAWLSIYQCDIQRGARLSAFFDQRLTPSRAQSLSITNAVTQKKDISLSSLGNNFGPERHPPNCDISSFCRTCAFSPHLHQASALNPRPINSSKS